MMWLVAYVRLLIMSWDYPILYKWSYLKYIPAMFHWHELVSLDFSCWDLLKFAEKVKMGRRSISTTKSGKFMNPTDQASKIKIFNWLPKRLFMLTFAVVSFLNCVWMSLLCYNFSSLSLFTLIKERRQERGSLRRYFQEDPCVDSFFYVYQMHGL